MKELIEEMAADSGYGCAVANRFGRLLDDESDPFDMLYQAQVKTEQRKKKEELKKVVTSTKTSKKESQRDRKGPVGAGENTANRAVAGELFTNRCVVIGACAVKEKARGLVVVTFFPQARSGLFALLHLRSEEKDAWPSVKPSSVRGKFLWATPSRGEANG